MEILSRLQKLKQKQASVNPEIRSWLERQPSFDRWATLERLEGCGTLLLLREWQDHEGKVTLKAANFCGRHMLCRTCAARRAAKTVEKHSRAIRHVLGENKGLHPAMVTLTVKNGPDLEERFRHLADSWRIMTNRAAEARKNPAWTSPIEWNKVRGFVRACEVTNRGNGWHPHFHAIVLLSDWIDVHRLAEEWFDITGDSMIVDVRAVYSDDEENPVEDPDTFDPIAKACIEAMKYSVKFGDLDGSQIAEVWHSLHGRRMISSGGLLRGLKMEDALTDADLTGPYRDFWGIWIDRLSSYTVQATGASDLRYA